MKDIVSITIVATDGDQTVSYTLSDEVKDDEVQFMDPPAILVRPEVTDIDWGPNPLDWGRHSMVQSKTRWWWFGVTRPLRFRHWSAQLLESPEPEPPAPVEDPDEMLSAVEFAKRAGCSYRQVDYWLRRGHFGYTDTPGSGYRRKVAARHIPIARTLANLTAGMNNGQFQHRIIAGVIDNYATGRLDLGGGLTLTWPVER